MYQLIVFPADVAFKLTLFPWQMVVAEGVTEVGAEGVPGCALTTALADANEVQLEEFVTVNLYVVFAVKPVTVLVVPVLDKLPDGLPVTVQEPAGKSLDAILAVADKHVG